MERSEVLDKVRKCTIEIMGAGTEAKEVTEGSRYTEDLGLDSLDLVELVISLENEFEVDVPDEDVEKIGSIGQTVDYIIGKLT